MDCGDHHVGLRASTVAGVDALRERLGALVVTVGGARNPSVSLRVGARRGAVTDTHAVYRGSVRVFHTFSLDAAIEAASALLWSFGSGPPGCVRFFARPLRRGTSVVLVSEHFASALDSRHRRVSMAGYTALPFSPVWVDVPRAHVLLPRWDDPTAAPVFERVPLTHVLAGVWEPERGVDTAFGLLQLKSLISGSEQPPRAENLRCLGDLADRVPFTFHDRRDPGSVVEHLLTL
ncbi:MAG: hypothetical protein AMXMBFR46_07660 [Acidimicrobiia bacterium]